MRFRRRLMCPVVDVRGNVTGYSGRVLDARAKAAKYVNSPETPIFTKGDQLYGAYTARSTARRAGRVILCEGNLDVVALWQAGFPGTVAAMGTALTPRQVRLVKRLSDQVICVMDGDAAGAKAAFASLLPFLEEGIQPRAVLLSGGHDPDSYVRENGADAFRALLASARPLLDLYIEREATSRPADALGRAEGLRALAPALRLLQDPLARDLYRQQVSATLGVGLDFVDRAIAEAVPAPAAAAPPAPPPAPPPPPPVFDPPPMWEPDEAGAYMDLPDGPDTPPPPAPVRPMPPLPRYERELAEYIADFPDLAVDLVRREGHKYLTHGGLADFLVRLCREVESDAVLDEDRLLREFPDAQVVAFWRERQARPSGLDRTHVRRALHDAVLRLEHGHWRRQRKDILRRLRAAPGGELAAELAEANRRLALITQRLSTPTTQPPAEGAN
ncbi:MAG: toprim domain-containing protein [bacterium]